MLVVTLQFLPLAFILVAVLTAVVSGLLGVWATGRAWLAAVGPSIAGVSVLVPFSVVVIARLGTAASPAVGATSYVATLVAWAAALVLAPRRVQGLVRLRVVSGRALGFSPDMPGVVTAFRLLGGYYGLVALVALASVFGLLPT